MNRSNNSPFASKLRALASSKRVRCKRAFPWLLGCTLAATTGCQSVGTFPLGTSAASHVAAANSPTLPYNGRSVSGNVGAAPTRSLNDQSVQEAPENSAPQSDIAQVAYNEPVAQQPLYDPPGAQLHTCNPYAQGAIGETCACGDSHEGACAPAWPAMPINPWDKQEYVVDGGDRDQAVVVMKDGRVEGLDVEDTVVHYETVDGDTIVEPSCQTKIYAPRFAAVRKTTGLNSSELVQAARGAVRPDAPVIQRDQLPSSSLMLGVQPRRENAVKLVEQFRDRNRGTPAESVVPPIAISDSLSALAELNLLAPKVQEDMIAFLEQRKSLGIGVCDIADQVELMVEEDEAQVVLDKKSAQEIFIYEIRDKYRMRICKVASDTMANPGDVILFVIRFDNAGDQTIKKAVILDNLSPRLEYIDGSQESIVAGKKDAVSFSTTENEAGSAVLRWQITTDLKVGDGGWIGFKCRVR